MPEPHLEAGRDLAPSRPKRVLLVGPYGGVNLGDELILHEIASAVRSGGHEVVTTSIDPGWTRDWHGLEAFARFDARRLRLHPLRHVRDVDAVVIGGGEQLQESASRSPFWGLLATVAAWTAAARMARKPVLLWGVGVEPLATSWGRWMTARICRSAAAVTVRDPASYRRLAEFGCSVELVADPVFNAPREDHEAARQRVLRLLGLADAGQPLLLLSLANDRRISLDYVEPLIEACHRVASQRGGVVALHLMDRREQYDQGLLRLPALAALPRLEVGKADWVADLRKLHAAADVVVSSRMHPLILAATQGTPWVNIARGSKMRSLAAMFGRPAIDLDGLETTAVELALTAALEVGRSAWQRQDDAQLTSLREAAARPAGILERLLARQDEHAQRPREIEVGR